VLGERDIRFDIELDERGPATVSACSWYRQKRAEEF
jgi:hypothetical protein